MDNILIRATLFIESSSHFLNIRNATSVTTKLYDSVKPSPIKISLSVILMLVKLLNDCHIALAYWQENIIDVCSMVSFTPQILHVATFLSSATLQDLHHIVKFYY